MTATTLFLVTGVSGAGKTALAHYLTGQGEHARSLDAITGLCRWESLDGHPVQRPEQPPRAWLHAHRWRWRPEVLDALVARDRASGHERAFWCGTAANQLDLLDRFDIVVLLDIPAGVQTARVRRHRGGNDFGRCGDTAAVLTERFDADRARLRAAIGHVIDATAPLPVVADQIRHHATRHRAET